MKISTKLLRMFSAFCAFILLGLTANAQSITVSGGLTANQMAQLLVGSNVTVSNAVYTGAATASGSFNQGSSTFPLANGIILTSGSRTNALGPNNSTGASASNGTPGDAALTALAGGVNTFDAAILEFDITSNCNTVTFDYIFASEEYPEYACSNFNDVFGFFITGPGYAPNTNIALVPGTSTPVSINNVINSPSTNCVSNPTFYVNNANGLSIQYDGRTVTLTATASIQPCQTYHIKIAVADAGDSALDSAVFLKGGGINCSSPNLTATANITNVGCGVLGAIDLTLGSGTGPFTYAWTGPNNFTATTQDLTGLAAGVYTVTVTGANCLSSGQFTYTVAGAVDVTPPVFTNCPSNITIQAANPACTFAVNVPTPTVSDNCPNVTVTSTPAPGTPFSVGTTPVTYTATDAAGNSSTCTFNVIVNAQPLVVTLTPLQYAGGVNIKCFGQFSGQVTAGAAGGCYPYTYSWINPITGLPMSQTVATPAPVVVPGLPAGPFTMTVTDGNLTTVTQTVTLIQNPPVQAVVTQTPILCNGGTSTVVITAQAGTSPYNGLTTYNVFPGTYIYLVTDANGCRNRDTIVVTQPAILDATATPTPILCWGDTSQVTVAATGGTAPYTGTGVFNQVAGVYTYVVTDANGCTDNTQLAVNQPQELTATISSTPILCYGGTSQVTVSVASGTEPYTGTGVFTEYAGNYTYTVYDYNLCEDTISITVTEPSDMVTTVTATPILCAGGTTNITVTGSGGTGAWNGTGTFTETAGTYGYSLLDANGCTDSVSVTVNEPTQLVASISSTSILCNGGSSDITVTATGGTAPYTGTGVYSETAGTHTYTVTDANGCSVTVSTTVTEPTQLTAAVSSTSIDCNGGSSDITVTATGGTAPYTGTGTFNVTAGTYDYTVTDANGCSVTVSTTVTEPTQLTAAVSSTSIKCNGGTSVITVSATGGTAPYTNTGTFIESAGTYTYVVTDANGCSDTVTITVTEPTQLVVTATATPILCYGGTSTVTLTATGGTPAYLGLTSYTVTAGTYIYLAVDSKGCRGRDTITITQPDILDVMATSSLIYCFGDTTDVVVAATGGTAPYTGVGTFFETAGIYTYTVNDANGCVDSTTIAINQPAQVVFSVSSTPILCNGGTSQVTLIGPSGCIISGGPSYTGGSGTITVGPGTFTYTMISVYGCTADTTITITEPPLLVASAISTSIACNGGSSDITVTATGGTAPYTGTGVYSETAGTHTYTVTDANGCSTTVSTTVTEPAALSASVSSTSIDCAGGSSDITVTATGGTSPYTGTGVYSQTAGTYMYTVTDANGCSVTVSTTVTEPTALSASISSTSIDCAGGSSDITVTATGGTAPYTGTGVYTEAAGTYTYTVTDANGCSVTVSTTVTEPAQLLVSLSSAGIACNGGSADITVSATGGTAPYTGTGIFNVGTGTYTYTVTDANGCSASESITIVEPTLMTAYVSCPAPIACNGGTADIAVFAFGGTAPYTGIGVFTVGAGTYTYTVTDANGCTSTVSHTVTEPAPVNVSIASSGIACNGGSSNLTVSATGGTAPYTGTGTFNVTAGTYSYTITDANGCTGTATITVAAPAPLVASATAAPILCFGGTANVTVSATGGTAPYTGTGIFNVGAGTYTYTVTDANGCSATTSVTLTQPTLMTAYASCPMIACNGGTADLAVFAFGGTAPYSGIGVFNVGAGTYTYTVTDANGCTASVTHTVTQPAPVNVSIVSSGINCNGGTANLTVSATGGTAPYTGTGTFNVSAGTYSYTITDANGCTGTATITVAAPAPLVASASAGSILCFGGTANVTVSATGGTAPYTGTGTFNVAAGTYTYTVTDSKGCTATTSVTLTQPTQMTAYASCPVIACNGGTANLAVFAFGGTAPYTGTGVFTVGAGTYTYTVTDANGCTSTVTHTVTQPAALVATATVSNLNCANGTGNVTIAATGGTAPYTGTGLFVQANGTQTYTVTDAKGCVTTVSATVVIQNFVNLTCPGNQTFACASTQSCGQSSNGATISWTAPTASSYNSCNNGCGSNTAIPGFMYMGEYNGSRYYCSSTSNFGWQAANTAANNAGGHLVTIQSPAENQFVKNLIGAQEVWIGFTDQNVEGTFQWINGESVGYTNWASTDPDNSGPLPSGCTNCGQADYTIMKKTSGSWLDRFECEKHEFVMEIPCGNPITITQTAGPANGSFANGGTSQVVTYVAVDQVTGASATCSFTVTVGQCAPVYCQSSGSCTAYEWIKKVTLGSINNQSGNNGGYANFTALSTTATVGSVVNLQLTPGFASTVYTEAWRVWIDWNYDGDFNDQGEMVYQGTGTSVMNGSFTVPSFATLNTNLRVRVSMRWDCYAGPCSSFQYGEVEDYTIIIQPGVPDGMATVIGETDRDSGMKQGNTSADNVKMYDDVIEDGSSEGGYGLELGAIYPNPVLSSNGKVNLDVRTGSETDITVRIYDLSGKILLTDMVHLEIGAHKSAIDVTGFARGSYIIEVTNGELRETTQLIVQ